MTVHSSGSVTFSWLPLDLVKSSRFAISIESVTCVCVCAVYDSFFVLHVSNKKEIYLEKC